MLAEKIFQKNKLWKLKKSTKKEIFCSLISLIFVSFIYSI